MIEGEALLPPSEGTPLTDKEITKVPTELKEIAKEPQMGGQIKIGYKEQFSGPIPPPRIMAQYRIVMDDAPERIFVMAEKNQEHRHTLERTVIQSDIRRADLGLILGFSLFVMFGVGAVVLLVIGKDIQGFSVLAISVLGGAGNLIRVGRERQKDQQKDNQASLAQGKKKQRKRH